MVRVVSNNGIPKVVLAGRIPKYRSVNTVFLSETIREWYRLAYRSYIMRSDLGRPPNMSGDGNPPVIGRPDDDKKTWKQLKPSTYRTKKSLQKTGAYTKHLEKINTVAANYVLGLIQTMNYRSGDGTNIRTGRLLAAFFPPRMSGGRLVAGPDQSITISGLHVNIEFKIPYAKRITLGYGLPRPIFVDGNDEDWMQKATLVGIREARKEYDRLVARHGEYAGGSNDNRTRPRSRRK